MTASTTQRRPTTNQTAGRMMARPFANAAWPIWRAAMLNQR